MPEHGTIRGGTPVTITGKNLTDAASVAIGATSLGAGDFIVVSDTEIQTTSPAGTSAVNVTVTTSSATSNGEPYTYVATPTDVQAMMSLAALAANAFGARPSGEAPADQGARILLGVGSQLERFVAKRMNATTTEIASSHVPMLSHPDVVLDVIRAAAAACQ